MHVLDKFAELKIKQEKALIAFLPGNFPTPSAFVQAANCILEAGADVLEVGIPFSDPLADGQTISNAYYKLIGQNENLEKILQSLKIIAKSYPNKAFVLMSYANPLLAAGAALGLKLRETDVSAVVVPDVPFEEKKEIEDLMPLAIKVVGMLSPTTSKQRQIKIAKETESFIYCVAVTGVTGERSIFNIKEVSFLEQLRSVSNVPVVVGFGISEPEHAKIASEHADGVVIGSKLISLLKDEKQLKSFIKKVKSAINTR